MDVARRQHALGQEAFSRRLRGPATGRAPGRRTRTRPSRGRRGPRSGPGAGDHSYRVRLAPDGKRHRLLRPWRIRPPSSIVSRSSRRLRARSSCRGRGTRTRGVAIRDVAEACSSASQAITGQQLLVERASGSLIRGHGRASSIRGASRGPARKSIRAASSEMPSLVPTCANDNCSQIRR